MFMIQNDKIFLIYFELKKKNKETNIKSNQIK
jgi:hypothetical protein